MGAGKYSVLISFFSCHCYTNGHYALLQHSVYAQSDDVCHRARQQCTALHLRQSVSLNRLSFCAKTYRKCGTPAPRDLRSLPPLLLPLRRRRVLSKTFADATALVVAARCRRRFCVPQCAPAPHHHQRVRLCCAHINRRAQKSSSRNASGSRFLSSPRGMPQSLKKTRTTPPDKVEGGVETYFPIGAARVLCCSNLTRKSTPLFIIHQFLAVCTTRTKDEASFLCVSSVTTKSIVFLSISFSLSISSIPFPSALSLSLSLSLSLESFLGASIES